MYSGRDLQTAVLLPMYFDYVFWLRYANSCSVHPLSFDYVFWLQYADSCSTADVFRLCILAAITVVQLPMCFDYVFWLRYANSCSTQHVCEIDLEEKLRFSCWWHFLNLARAAA